MKLSKEIEIAKYISKYKERFFVVEMSEINKITIGGIDGHLAFETSKVNSDQLVILEYKTDDKRVYFKPIISDETILINSEDYLFEDEESTYLGEIVTSTNRKNSYLKNENIELYNSIDSSYVRDNYELVFNNPLCVKITSLIPLNSLPNGGTMEPQNNMDYSGVINLEIKRLKKEAQEDLRWKSSLLNQKSKVFK